MRCDIGVAIEVPEPWAYKLRRWREHFGDSSAHGIPPHITLLPPTSVTVDRIPAAEGHLDAVAARAEPFGVELSGTATFRPVSPVVFIPLVAGIAPCERLAAAVRSGPLSREVRFPYHPHVTVAQEVGDPALDAASRLLRNFRAAFAVPRFTLFERSRAGEWRARREFPLGASAALTSAAEPAAAFAVDDER